MNTERIVLLDPLHTVRNLAALRAWAVRFSSNYAVTAAPWRTVVEPARSSALPMALARMSLSAIHS